MTIDRPRLDCSEEEYRAWVLQPHQAHHGSILGAPGERGGVRDVRPSDWAPCALLIGKE